MMGKKVCVEAVTQRVRHPVGYFDPSSAGRTGGTASPG